MLGYDTEVLPLEDIEALLGSEEFTLFSRNAKFCKYREEHSNLLYIPFEGLETQLYFLSKRGMIEINEAAFSRCTICNIELEQADKGQVKDSVPPYVFKTQKNFLICPSCKKIYWKASHILKIEEKIKRSVEARSLINIGVTAGDINGAGPQIIWKLFVKRKDLFRQKRIFIIGSYDVMEFYRKKYLSFSKKLSKSVLNIVKDTKRYYPGELNLIDVGMRKNEKLKPGSPTDDSGKVTHRTLERSLELHLSGEIDLIVNTPNSKESLNLAGFPLKGATEFYSGGSDALMTFFSPGMKLALLTRHIPIAQVSETINKDMLLAALRILRGYGRIGVLGLNPHASEGGIIGNEEKDIIIPALEAAAAEGIDVAGPMIPDTFFMDGDRDIYLSIYHDQLLPLFKNSFFKKSFQASLGIDVKRISVSHGTAWSTVDDFSASEESLEYILDGGMDSIIW